MNVLEIALWYKAKLSMLKSGHHLDERYIIKATLGNGGMAHVYRAFDTRLERDVALKVLRPHLTETDSERFRREIRTLAQLNHHGVVTIYDLGSGELVYFAMELVEGGIFTDLGPFEPDVEPARRLLSAAITVAETLTYVHKLGIVHRDLTPRNILMTAQDHPKVMDFGLVQLTESSRDLTRTGFTLGTPHYMAPEQAQGDVTGAHTDLYALGAVLYRALTGVEPFDADNDQAILYQHVYGDLIAPIDHNPYVPVALSNLVVSMLAKDPKARPLNGAVVADALKTILSESEAQASHQRMAGPAQQGVYPYGPSDPKGFKEVWRSTLPEGPQWPAALTAGGGFIFVGLRSDEICVLHPADGSQQVSFQADDEVNTAPLFLENHLFYTSRDGSLNAITWPRGAKSWQDEDAQAVGLCPYGSELLVTTYTGRLERRSLKGEVRWHYQAEAAAKSLPIVHRAQAFFLSADGWLHSVDVHSGKGKFKIELGQLVATPAAKAGLLLLPEREGALHAFDIESHEVKWTYDLDGEVWASPALWQSYVFVASWGQVLRCLSLQTGDDIWAYKLGAKVTATPVIASGVLYTVTEAGQLYAFDAATGTLLNRVAVSLDPIQASPLILGTTLIVASLGGTVKAYR